MWSRWCSRVFSLMTRARAIWRLLSPLASSRVTSSSHSASERWPCFSRMPTGTATLAVPLLPHVAEGPADVLGERQALGEQIGYFIGAGQALLHHRLALGDEGE